MKRMLRALAAIGLALSAAACDRDKAGTTTTKTETTTESRSRSGDTDKTVETETTTVTRTTETRPTQPSEEVGVAQCDEHLRKLADCSTKVAPAAAGAMKESIVALRKVWQEGASTPEGKTALAATCTQARDAARSAYVETGCAF